MPTTYVPESLTTNQAAAYLGVSANTLRTYRKRGGGPEFILVTPHLIMYRLTALKKWAKVKQREERRMQELQERYERTA